MELAEGEEVALVKLPFDANLEHTDCIICFEALTSRGGAIPLPCECRVPYCADCWDRALAASISACGRALCPSCRGAMRVDFDAALGRLLFSRAPASELGADAPDDDWRKRLYEQAKPMQIKLLRRFGAERPSQAALSDGTGVAAAGVTDDIDDRGYAAEEAPEATSGGMEQAAVPFQPARCVCGCALVEVSVRDRVRTFVQEEAPATPPRSVIERLMMIPPIVCDICDRRVKPASKVWTCENGRRTMLHAVAYDVCERCFSRYALGIDDDDSENDEQTDDDDSAEGGGASTDDELF